MQTCNANNTGSPHLGVRLTVTQELWQHVKNCNVKNMPEAYWKYKEVII